MRHQHLLGRPPQAHHIARDHVHGDARALDPRQARTDVGRSHNVGVVHGHHLSQRLGAMRPSIGLDADAYSLRGMRPARYASRPASQAYRIAHAIRSGSWAWAMPVLSRTPSQPSSMATVTSLAVPTPASTITG